MDYQTKLRSALDLFVSDDDARPELKLPFVQGKYVFATDLCALLAFPKRLLDDIEEFDTRNDLPNCLTLILEKENTNVVFEVQKLRAAIYRSKIAVEKRYKIEQIVCPDCDGVGVVDYKFKDSKSIMHATQHSCPTCDEEGQIEMITDLNTGGDVNFFSELVSLDGAFFQTHYFEKIVKLAEMLDQETITLVRKNIDGYRHNFTIDGCVACIMPVLGPDEESVVTNINE